MVNFGVFKLVCVVVMCMVVVAAPFAEAAVSCNTVESFIIPCINYLQTGAPTTKPPFVCCNGVSELNNPAKSTPDRQTACNCLKNSASKISGIKWNLAASLPNKCGITFPYEISPNIDCTKVH